MAFSNHVKPLLAIGLCLGCCLSALGCASSLPVRDGLTLDQQISNGEYMLSDSAAADSSNVVYVVNDDAPAEHWIQQIPLEGGETVLDIIAAVGGLTSLRNANIEVLRPSPDGSRCEERLAVNWTEITQEGKQATNYTLLSGDRVVIHPHQPTFGERMLDKAVAPLVKMCEPKYTWRPPALRDLNERFSEEGTKF